MKKFFYYAMMLMLAGFTMTSCETDEQIARKLTDVDWEGNLNTYYSNRWGEEFLDGEYRTVWRFEADYYDSYGNATRGYGFETDYDYNHRGEYAYSSFRWEVRGGNIYIDYDDRTWNPVRIDWCDYRLSYSHFSGTGTTVPTTSTSTATAVGAGTTTATTATAPAPSRLTAQKRPSTSARTARASPQASSPRH